MQVSLCPLLRKLAGWGAFIVHRIASEPDEYGGDLEEEEV